LSHDVDFVRMLTNADRSGKLLSFKQHKSTQ
jgi:hypothetical protein